MRARISFGLALSLALAACQNPSPSGTSRTPAPGRSPAEATAAPVAAAPAAMLRALPGQSTALTGRVSIDANYAAGFGGASLAVASGTPLVLLDGGKLVGNAGGTLVGNAGGTMVANAAGQIVAQGGGNVIAPASVAGTAALITNDGGSLITNDGGSYRLAAASTTTFGEVRPAVGMWLAVVDSRTGVSVPLGTDAAGKSVYTIYTDGSGGFKVQIPAGIKNPRVVVRAPRLRDRKLVLGVLPTPGADIVVDPSQAATTAFVRSVMRGRLLTYLGISTSTDPATQVIQAALTASGFDPVKSAYVATRAKVAEDRRADLDTLLVDAVLADVDLRGLKLSTTGVTPRHPASAGLVGLNTLDEIGGVLKRLQAATVRQAQGTSDPATFFAAKPYLVAANLLRSPATRYRIEGPADMSDFLAQEYLSAATQGQTDKAFGLLDDLGLDLTDRDRLAMASATMLQAMASALIGTATEGESLNARLLSILNGVGAKLATAPPAAPAKVRPVPPLPAPPPFEAAAQVDTMALPLGDAIGFAIDASVTPPVLYVSEEAPIALRRITFDGAGVPTAKTLSTQVAGMLVHDGQGHLYASNGSATIARFDTAEATLGAVTIIANGGTGYLDGPGATAKFAGISALALDPKSGDLFVAEQTNHRVRRVALGQPGFPVTTAMGTGLALHVEGPMAPQAPGTLAAPNHPGASFSLLTGLAFAADGSLVLQDATSGLSTVQAPLTPTSWSHLLAGSGTQFDGDAYYHNAGINSTVGVAATPDDRLVIADTTQHRISLVTRDGWVHTIAGGPQPGKVDGAGDQARFNAPRQPVVAQDGTIYVLDPGNHVIRRIRRGTPARP
ncbi:MAG: gluconolaconase [Cyanobacteria bacterium RYN_339]|nr:gluconolaconase [Cyanobacteria bacterium RYN_339]